MGAREGRCLCGAVHLTAHGVKGEFHACHCPICQKWAGGVMLGFDCERVDVAEGEHVGVYRSSEWAERVFCTACGAGLVWRLHDHSMPVVAAAALDDLPDGATLTLEYFIDAKPAGYAMAGEHKRMTAAEVEAFFGGDDAGQG